jgi:glycosyltransferase involved in cell wall biosynthesis
VFVGRLVDQKGIDLFVDIAREIRKSDGRAQFAVFGDGDKKKYLEEASVEWHTHVPEDDEIPPLSEVELKLGIWQVKFEKILGISYKDGKSWGRRAFADREKDALEQEIFKRGFSAKAVSVDGFTHRITVRNCSDGMNPDYLIKTWSLESIRREPTQFIWPQGSLPWVRRFEAFNHASVVVVPSRFEPFGLVILESMRQGVPVIYTASSGAAEVLRSGIRAAKPETFATEALKLLNDKDYWEQTVEAQLAEVSAYHDRHYESLLTNLWAAVTQCHGSSHA